MLYEKYLIIGTYIILNVMQLSVFINYECEVFMSYYNYFFGLKYAINQSHFSII